MAESTGEDFRTGDKMNRNTSVTRPDDKEIELLGIGDGRAIERPDDKEKSQSLNSDCLTKGRGAIAAVVTRNPQFTRITFLTLLNLGIFVYFGFATHYWYTNYFPSGDYQWCDGYGMLVILLAVVYGFIFYFKVVKIYFGESILNGLRPVGRCWQATTRMKYIGKFVRPICYLAILVAIVVFMVFDTVDSRDRLISVIGVVFLIAFGWIFSKHPAHINWNPVILGLVLQFLFGVLTIRWSVGRAIFQCIADKTATFLNYSQEGAIFVYSEELVSTLSVFAFSSLSVVFFFSVMIQILYYVGAMQWTIMKLGWALQKSMGTTVCESMIAVGNTLLSMTESSLLIKPCIPSLTSSELHTVMTSGFATVSGTVLAAYISFGAQPAHLITASFMSAPAALCYSKLFYPETEESKTTFENIEIRKSEDRSLLDAAANGALAGIPLVLGIIANVIAFVSLIAMMNGITTWFGVLVGYEDVTVELFLSKVLMPLSWVMGVPWDECEMVARLIALKTMVNEFVAYQKLGEYKEASLMTPRTEAIATYALCGFSNPGSVGIMIGALTSLAPGKKEEIVAVAWRAFVAGSAVCFMTACIAGMLMTDDFYTTVSSGR